MSTNAFAYPIPGGDLPAGPAPDAVVHQSMTLDGYAIMLSPLELAAVLTVTGVLFLIVGALLHRNFELRIQRRPRDDGGWWPEDDGPDPDDPVLTAPWPPAPPDVVPGPRHTVDEPVDARSRALWPLNPPRQPGRHRLRRDTPVYYRPGGVI